MKEKYYVPANAIVEAKQVEERTEVKTPNGIMIANVGDWILTDSNKKYSIISNEIFQELYYVAQVRAKENSKFKKMLKMIKG